ncbi:MAG: hypothetical protein OXB92_00930 [Acidimicrobiaceae bacterium]|nr:hypothetical protein [Acidimicrobiia bacterium]MCY4492405.1 hypothetical protein [Acidimicrobiaceae bacterium]
MVLESPVAVTVPEQGNLVRVRDRFWVQSVLVDGVELTLTHVPANQSAL